MQSIFYVFVIYEDYMKKNIYDDLWCHVGIPRCFRDVPLFRLSCRVFRCSTADPYSAVSLCSALGFTIRRDKIPIEAILLCLKTSFINNETNKASTFSNFYSVLTFLFWVFSARHFNKFYKSLSCSCKSFWFTVIRGYNVSWFKIVVKVWSLNYLKFNFYLKFIIYWEGVFRYFTLELWTPVHSNCLPKFYWRRSLKI